MKKRVESVVIVGGGSSGWMTAAAISKQLPNVKLTLIESPNIPTIGVGESTIGQINEFLQYLGLKDEDWMKHCNATYKTSIKFIDFRENPTQKPHVFHYPFGRFDFTDKPKGLMDWFSIAATHPNIDPYSFAEFFHSSVVMTDAGKMTKNENHAIRGFDFNSDTAYHMDATLFGNYLRDAICLPSGMTHILDNVLEACLNDEGEIGSIISENNGAITADLFIDCTGFKSLLIEKSLNVPFISFHDTLMNDRAVAAVIPYIDINKEMECVTSCTAIESGWVWNIPLWNRIGTGYVYSSQFATEEEAERQFRCHLKSNRMICQDDARVDDMEVRHIKIKHGVHEKTWEKNVVGIGLANGFIEPLESTGLMLTHECIMKLVNLLKVRKGRVTKFDVDCFNFAFREQIFGFKDFISQHYALSMRNDTPYWNHVTEEVTYSPQLVNFDTGVLNSYNEIAYRNNRSRYYSNDMGGIVYIAAGMGLNPTDNGRVEFLLGEYGDSQIDTQTWLTWQEHRVRLENEVKALPTHYEFLKSAIYGES
jgi:flavin-dependent dehydrogenase